MTEEQAIAILTKREQCAIINGVNENLAKEDIPEAQSEAGEWFYNALMEEKKEMPDVIFECPEIDDEDEASETLRKIMFDDPVEDE
ncbi:MAG TPA: hypothetical protein GXX46_05655 [Peptococcaceae bacterium]|nr:hypothetical protein [Peptococcaceae bacterium]